MIAPDNIRLKRLQFRSSHRGCKESDILIGQFCEQHLAGLEPALVDALEALLDEDDTAIWDWLTGKQPVPEPYQALVARLNAFSVTF